MHPLEGAKLKIIRAKEQLDYFYREADLFLTSHPLPYEIITQTDFKKLHYTRYKVRIKINRHPPRSWGVVVGEIAHDLRSALDNLVWQLALLTTDSPSRSTEFPIFNSIKDFNDPKFNVNGKLRHIPVNARTVIESFQPYNSGNRPPVEYLWWLHEINRVDKHREIIPCYSHPIFKVSNRSYIYRLVKSLSDDDIVYVDIPNNAGKLQIGIEIAFKITTFDYLFPANRLSTIYKFVSEEVIPRFEVFF
jgi:hypothetical protein